jgi:hypothetical protein
MTHTLIGLFDTRRAAGMAVERTLSAFRECGGAGVKARRNAACGG